MNASEKARKTVLWWGRFDPNYSRNRILRQAFQGLGWRITDFHPKVSRLGHLEAALRQIKSPDLVWLPAFRQRDMAAASAFAKAHKVPLVFDPMISAYDKQVFERQKFEADSGRARSLLAGEQALFAKADHILADTSGHAEFFISTLKLPAERVHVVALGAEEGLFAPAPLSAKPANAPVEALFYGSFISLQAPGVIVEAAKLCAAPIRWVLLGDGPLKAACARAAEGQSNIIFEDYLPYDALPARIHQADILLGVFGESDKAARVIPNKVYQSLASGRVVVSRASDAYPAPKNDGLIEIAPGNPAALSDVITRLTSERADLARRGEEARAYYDRHFSTDSIRAQLATVLETVSGG